MTIGGNWEDLLRHVKESASHICLQRFRYLDYVDVVIIVFQLTMISPYNAAINGR